MRSVARWFLVSVLAVDAAFVVLLLAGGLTARADDTSKKAAGQEEAGEVSVWTQQALTDLGERLGERSREIARREAELEELARAQEVLRLSGVPDQPQAKKEEAKKADRPDNSEAFKRLQKAYENMEPDSAAQALSKLSTKDEEAVVQLILGWQPRTSGAILDALTQQDPQLAADLSYAIWKMDGKKGAAAAGSGR